MRHFIKFFAAVLSTLFCCLFLAGCAPAASSSVSSGGPPLPSSSPSSAVSSQPEPPYASPIDWKTWQERNADIYAWITIPGTNVDYPILQSNIDDEYYLRRDVDGNDLLAGSLFTQATYNTRTFDDPHTVIYGHNMESLDGTMFSQVHQYRLEDFFNEHREIVVYLPNKELHYTVFSAYTWGEEHLLYTYDSRNPSVFQNYLDSIFQNRDMEAVLADDVTLTSDDKIITLSTCETSYPGASRYLVQAVLEDTIE